MGAHYWTYDRVMETAARCRTYREFYLRYPLAYEAACNRKWLAAVVSHCGWRKVDKRVLDEVRPLPLDEILRDHGSLLIEAMDDPRWPMDVEDRAYGDMVFQNS